MQSTSAEYSGAPFGNCSAKHAAQDWKSASAVQSTTVLLLLLDEEEDEELELVLTVVPPEPPPPVLPPAPPPPESPPAEEPELFDPQPTREPAATTNAVTKTQDFIATSKTT